MAFDGPQHFHVSPLGEQALLLKFEDEQSAWSAGEQIRRSQPAWLIDLVQAYVTIAIYFDLRISNQTAIRQQLPPLIQPGSNRESLQDQRLHEIPCCYDLALDLDQVAEKCQATVAEVVEWHSQEIYTVYAIGFCPGFPYLGYLPKQLSGLPRRPTPRVRVEEGSVGLTGRQTGIYTQVRPGGWNIIGRTPLQLVDIADEYFPLRTGDRVKFSPISDEEFHDRRGERLASQ